MKLEVVVRSLLSNSRLLCYKPLSVIIFLFRHLCVSQGIPTWSTSRDESPKLLEAGDSQRFMKIKVYKSSYEAASSAERLLWRSYI